jgi:GNAT superfamily N-acetyltransferase
MLVSGYTIRLSRRSEVGALPDIEQQANQLFASHAGELGLRSDQVPELSSVAELLIANDDGRLWVAADDQGQIVGFALVVELGLFAHLEEMDVLPAHGRQGLGSALLEAVCSWAYSRGFSAVTLSTFRDVAWNAPFYARRGFSVLPPEELPPELLEVVQRESKIGLRSDLRVIMQREV